MTAITETYSRDTPYGGSNTSYTYFLDHPEEFILGEDEQTYGKAQSVATSFIGQPYSKAGIEPFLGDWDGFTVSRFSNLGTVQIIPLLVYAELSGTAKRAIALLDEWLDDDSGYDEETWPELKESLDRDRLSRRSLF